MRTTSHPQPDSTSRTNASHAAPPTSRDPGSARPTAPRPSAAPIDASRAQRSPIRNPRSGVSQARWTLVESDAAMRVLGHDLDELEAGATQHRVDGLARRDPLVPFEHDGV